MTPVLLMVFKYSESKGSGSLEEIYAGVMSQKHIYAKRVVGNKASPEYIQVRRSYTRTDATKCSLGGKSEICAVVRELLCLNKPNLAKDGRVSILSKDSSIIPELNEVWAAAHEAEHRYL